ncbi:MAG: polysaccharide biosynthesis protein [Hyphomicrobiaceae bacterium]|nr:polysaccharide biosynthesis protein [Hyphomicrobiaceae bacterium]
MAKKTFRERLIDYPRWAKRGLLIGNDFLLLSIALWAAYSLRLGEAYVPPDDVTLALFVLAPTVGVITFYIRGLYRLVTRYFSQEAAGRLYVTIFLAVLIWTLLLYLIGLPGVPRSVVIIYAFFAAAMIRISRQFAGWLLQSIPNVTLASIDPRMKVLIYGAGDTGLQLLRSLRDSRDYRPIALVDDNASLWGQRINKLKVYRPNKIKKLIERDGVKEIFLAISSASRQRRSAVIRSLEDLPVTVKTLPALEDIASGKVEVSDLRPIDVEDLLGRDPVPPDASLLGKHITGKNVLITGAGGSIGSELTRQIMKRAPKRLILFDVSEVALYEIEDQAERLLKQAYAEAKENGTEMPDTEIIVALGSVLDRELVSRTIESHAVDTIYHAAAYKHVPIVEQNPFTGLQNNTFGTLIVSQAAIDAGVERMVLISTDKAVRPTNVMGASKRLAEMVLQALSAKNRSKTVFTMVRFGNVLDSSGSVVRRFRKQIHDGGPVTVTHPEIIRYFMSIPEAAELVLQAGSMAGGGEVFVLDMGSPVKIADLARTMIHLSGLAVRDEDHPDGDIAIEYVGLRQGEKLYEELLIGENTTGTKHPRIMKNSEPFLKWPALKAELSELELSIDTYDAEKVEAVLKRTVEGYTNSEQSEDVVPEQTGDWAPASRLIH